MPLGSERWATAAEGAPHERILLTKKRGGNGLEEGKTTYHSAIVRRNGAAKAKGAIRSKRLPRNEATDPMTMIVVAGGTVSVAQIETEMRGRARAHP